MTNGAGTILLRFRDLVANTIVEHKTVLKEFNHVWWGWWKRSDEPSRIRDLERVKALLEKGQMEIGLFDRSEKGRYFKATLTQCIYSSDDKALIKSPQPQATPAYYQAADLPAWFKLTGIDELSSDSPSFAKVFSISPVGNATFFPTWKDETVRPAASEEGPSSARGGILHISDVHFGEFAYPSKSGPGEYPLDDILVSDLEKLRIKVGLLIVSGDVTTRADANRLFNEVLPFLHGLASRLKLSPEQVIIVPGNHDIPLRDLNPHNYLHENTYTTFLSQFYGKPTETMKLWQFNLGKQRFEILTMNSVRLRSKSQKEYGYLEWPLYESLLKTVPRPDSDTIRLAVLHHHLVPAVREEIPDPAYPEAAISMTLDSGAVIEGLQEYGFKLALHGHQHVPRITRIGRGRRKDGSFGLDGLSKPLYIVGAGSVGTSRLFAEMRDNTYNVLVPINNKKLRLIVRRFNASNPPQYHIDQTLSL